MSTRNLTMVISGGETKVAQYGQSDGYPQGQGKTVLEFLQKCDLKKFKETLKEVIFLNPEESKNPDRQAEPGVYADAKVLQLIYDRQATGLIDSSNFARESLWCEWAYIIDLDKETLEVYRGFNKEPLTAGDRFFDKDDNEKDYYPVKIVKSYSLKNLPELEQFIKELTPDKSRNLGLSR